MRRLAFLPQKRVGEKRRRGTAAETVLEDCTLPQDEELKSLSFNVEYVLEDYSSLCHCACSFHACFLLFRSVSVELFGVFYSYSS